MYSNLTDELLRLSESLAANVQENWVRQRLAQGWKYGAHADADKKEHPRLVAFEMLPDLEKVRSRELARETLQALLASGYRLVPPGAGDAVSADDATSADLVKKIESPAADLGVLLSLWRDRDAKVWARQPQLYRSLAERLAKQGAPLLANEAASEGLEFWPGDLRLRQLLGLALARSGALERANDILSELEREGHLDAETMGLLGGTHKKLGLLAADAGERQRHLGMAFQLYSKAFRFFQSAWLGINAATLALLLDKKDLAQALARTVHAQCLEDKEKKDPERDFYWVLATLGEAALILGERAQAEDWYAQAATLGRKRLGDLNTTRRQVQLLLWKLGSDQDSLNHIFRVPRVIIFAGHMIDRVGRACARFPAPLESMVAKAIQERLQQLDGRIGYASAACGGDLLFLESILDRDGESHVILPYDQEVFLKDSVDIVAGGDWKKRFTDILTRATEVVTVSNQKMEGGSVSYDYANLVLHGLATVRATELQTELIGLALWDGKRGDGPGGTATVVERWRKLGLRVEHIDLEEMLRRENPALIREMNRMEEIDWSEPDFDTRIMAMLFADAIGFSKLTEEQVPRFVKHFLGAIGDLAMKSRNTSVARNTWGDGLYFVFEKVADAGLFALDLCDLVTSTRWANKGLPSTLSLRIALHAGPVYCCHDPITKQINYTGTHVSRAARIEPITPPGHVYASQAFAALASVERIRDFVCDYVKLASFAKGYGTFPTYVVRRGTKDPRVSD